ncbi:hypothetical protein [Arcobacter sp.]|uniref:hypothetical protein n=1 Tax=unclassified Arcobacter TaxID=2593671 RepID=UPI003B007150
MNKEIENKQIELIADKNGFLFEIEDKGYIIFRLYITILMLTIFLFLYAWNGFSLSNISDDGRLGRLAVYISLPFFIYQLFFIIIYNLKKEKRKIKFYEKYILVEILNYKIICNKIKKIYILESNNVSGKVLAHNKLFLIILFPIYLFSVCCSNLYLYILTKKNKVDNILFIMHNGDKISSISYRLLDNKSQQKVELYFKKYMNTDFTKIEKKAFLIPSK